jgi:hypothetical protein
VLKWLLYKWDPAHRLELVVSDISIDRQGVDVVLISVSWYAQTPKVNSAMYAYHIYGKQYGKLLQIAELLETKWYAMI